MLLTVGERVWEEFDPNIARMGTGWAGGIANAAELCGAVAAAVMLIGARHGHVTLDDSDTTHFPYPFAVVDASGRVVARAPNPLSDPAEHRRDTAAAAHRRVPSRRRGDPPDVVWSADGTRFALSDGERGWMR